MLRLGLIGSLCVVALGGCQELGPAAHCFEAYEDDEFGNPYIRNTCEYETPCDDVTLLCPGNDESVDCGPDTAIVEDPDALQCMLDGLARGEDGVYFVSRTAEAEPGWAVRSQSLWTRGKKGYFVSGHIVDLGRTSGGVRYVELRPRRHFAACRDAATAPEQLRCVLDPWREVLGVVIEPR